MTGVKLNLPLPLLQAASLCRRYKLVELVCYVIMGFFPALVILSMVSPCGEALGLSVRDKFQEGFENPEQFVSGGLVQSPGCLMDKAIPDMVWLSLVLQVLWVPSGHHVHLPQAPCLGSVVLKL